MFDWTSSAESWAIALSIAGAVLSLLMVVQSIGAVRKKRRAQDHVVHLLRHQLSESLRTQRQLRRARGDAGLELMKFYFEAVSNILPRLSESERRRVLEGLYQPSESGRARYLQSLFDRASVEQHDQAGNSPSTQGGATAGR